MQSLGNALHELRKDRTATQLRLEKLSQIIAGIESLNGLGGSHESSRPARTISAASRRKMAQAQRARWASIRNGSKPVAAVAKATASTPAKHTLSAAARRKIAAAQKARWAKIKAAKKKTA